MRFSTSLALLTVAVASANADDTCAKKGEIMCGEENSSLLLECDGSKWATSTCGSNMYCMTMNAAMIHCMLKPDNGDDETIEATATDSELGAESGSEDESAASSDADSSETSETKSGASSSFAIRGAVGMALAAVGLSALF
ncbi:hypothetical protein IWW50_002706 [Coemansia erecta]|nr:hypothetical protein IWW50_002706 [Coemansia erecta]